MSRRPVILTVTKTREKQLVKAFKLHNLGVCVRVKIAGGGEFHTILHAHNYPVDIFKHAPTHPPVILTITKLRAIKLQNNDNNVTVRINVTGGKAFNTSIQMQNPFNLEGVNATPHTNRLVGGAIKVGKVLKVAKRVVKKVANVAPLISAASDIAMEVGEVTGQPELVALGVAGKGVATVAKMAGGSKKKQNSKLLRYALTTEC